MLKGPFFIQEEENDRVLERGKKSIKHKNLNEDTKPEDEDETKMILNLKKYF